MEGILLLNKPKDRTSFSLVPVLRRLTRIQKIGHGGTLDPFATGVMVMLIGRSFTRLASSFLEHDKEYLAILHLGISTNTYDRDGVSVFESSLVPTLTEIQEVIEQFQGTILQTPPMFSAKKVKGKKLYERARKGIEIERVPIEISLKTTLIDYVYPDLTLKIACSKGTYIRSIAQKIGEDLKSGAHVRELTRLRSGPFSLDRCVDLETLDQLNIADFIFETPI